MTPDLYADVLIITTTAANDTTHYIPIHMTAQGAIIQQEPGVLINIGTISPNQTGTYLYGMRNIGNATTTLSLTESNTTEFGAIGNVVLNPDGTTQVAKIPYTSPLLPDISGETYALPASYSSTLTLGVVNTSQPLCKPLPSPTLTVEGNVPYSVFNVQQAASFDFTNSKVQCGSATPAAAQTFTISNSSVYPAGDFYTLTYVASLNGAVSDSYFTLSTTSTNCTSASTGFTCTLSQAAPSATFTVTPKVIPQYPTGGTQPHAYALEAIRFANTIFSTDIRYIYLAETAWGAVLEALPPSVAMIPSKVGTPTTLGGQLTIGNVGNLSTNGLSYSIAGTNAGDFSITSNTQSVSPGKGFTNIPVTFDPSATGARSATAKLTDTNGATGLCAALPTTAVPLTGTGQ